jgi:hypothetical protein
MQHLQKTGGGPVMVNQLLPSLCDSTFKRAHAQPSISFIFIFLRHAPTQRLPHNSFPINQLRTLSVATEGVPPFHGFPASEPSSLRILGELCTSAFSFTCFALSSPRLAHTPNLSPVTDHESSATDSHPPVPNCTDGHTLQRVYTPCAILPFLLSGDRPFLPPWRPS